MTITENELLQALEAAMPSAPANAMTAKELVALGYSQHQVSQFLGRLAMMDRLGVYKVPRTDRTGRTKLEPAYAILPPKGKGGRKK